MLILDGEVTVIDGKKALKGRNILTQGEALWCYRIYRISKPCKGAIIKNGD